MGPAEPGRVPTPIHLPLDVSLLIGLQRWSVESVRKKNMENDLTRCNIRKHLLIKSSKVFGLKSIDPVKYQQHGNILVFFDWIAIWLFKPGRKIKIIEHSSKL